MIILLHTSKTMRSPSHDEKLRKPMLHERAEKLGAYLKTLSPKELMKIMHVSGQLADKTHELLGNWSTDQSKQSVAMDSFVGDIYSGFRPTTLSQEDRDYANEHLRILSGLYGILRPYDGICPYRLEMGYRLPDEPFANLYKFWGDSIVKCIPESGLIVNLAAIEYSKTITPFVDAERIVAPKFLTVDPKTGEPTFVVVHTKIARGAFARWLITSRITTKDKLKEFNDIGYKFDTSLSTPAEPVFVCKEFGGKGLSMRLQN